MIDTAQSTKKLIHSFGCLNVSGELGLGEGGGGVGGLEPPPSIPNTSSTFVSPTGHITPSKLYKLITGAKHFLLVNFFFVHEAMSTDYFVQPSINTPILSA